MSYWQIRRAVAVWGSLLVGANHTAGTIVFGEDLDSVLTRSAANHISSGSGDRLQGNPINTGGGSALSGNGDIGFDGSQLYYRTGGTIYNIVPSGTIAL